MSESDEGFEQLDFSDPVFGLVLEELEALDIIANEYPKNAGWATRQKDEIMSDPSAFIEGRAEAMRVARESFPTLWRVMHKD